MLYAIEVAQTVASDEDARAISLKVGGAAGAVTVTMSREQAAELGNALLRANDEAFLRQDPTPWCSYGHATKAQCDCGDIASNE